MSLRYADDMIRSIMEGLGSNASNMAKCGRRFDPETLEVEVEFNENQSEIELLEMKREFRLEDDSSNAGVPKGQHEVLIEMMDDRTLVMFNGG